MLTRGTTPYHSFVLPLSTADIGEMYITYLQNGNVIVEKALADIDIVDINVEKEKAAFVPVRNAGRAVLFAVHGYVQYVLDGRQL